MRKIKVLKIESDEEKKNKIIPLLLEVPDHIVLDEGNRDQIKAWASTIQSESSYPWGWHRSEGIFLDETDTKEDKLLEVLFNAVEWAKVKGTWFKIPNDGEEAAEYALQVKQRIPLYEHLIVKKGHDSYDYAMNINEPFPAGEKAIAEDTYRSMRYAETLKTRIKAAEDEFAADDSMAKTYGEIMRKSEGWGSWTEDEVMRSPVWLFQYAKDFRKGPLTEALHSAMVMMSYNDAKNPWIIRYFKVKRYHPRKTKAKEAC